MERGNVLVISNSGVGKSTLINAVLGIEAAETGYGTQGVTSKLEIYESDAIPFRVIDTIGFEPTFFKEWTAIQAVKNWSKACAKEGQEDNQINVIWFCIDGTSRKLFPKAIQSLSRATAMWKTVPIVVVITKSYSVKERAENVAMVEAAFAKQRISQNLKKIIPVVAQTYELNETAFAAPEGITELIDVTNELMPEGVQAGQMDLANFKLKRKRQMANGVVGAATVSAVAVGATPLSIADAVILTPLEIAEINAIARIYGIQNDASSKQFFRNIVEVGTVGTAAKQAIAALKNIPGINIGAAALNAVVAGSIAAALGKGSIYIFEQIYLGNKTIEDIDWVTKVLESRMSTEIIDGAKNTLQQVEDEMDLKAIAKQIVNFYKEGKKK